MKQWYGLIPLILLLVSGCGGKKDEESSAPEQKETSEQVAVIVTRFGDIVLQFYPEAAPKHTANFIKLASEGFYDSTTFHRVIPDFVIQAGDPLSKDDDRSNDGLGSVGYKIDPEPNDHKHTRGAVGMARGQEPESNGSQFYICVKPQPHLDEMGFTIFAQVIKGMNVVDRIVSVPRDNRDNPLEPIYIEGVHLVRRSNVE
jgi:peptidyl-prolyl cis-trans isomerase B (cyclophilin B)